MQKEEFCSVSHESSNSKNVYQMMNVFFSKSFPRPMVHRMAPVSVSIALGHASVNTVKATVGGWSTGSSVCLTSHSFLIYRVPEEKAASTILKVFGMTRPGLNPMTF